jgi:hypothetical protein
MTPMSLYLNLAPSRTPLVLHHIVVAFTKKSKDCFCLAKFLQFLFFPFRTKMLTLPKNPEMTLECVYSIHPFVGTAPGHKSCQIPKLVLLAK